MDPAAELLSSLTSYIDARVEELTSASEHKAFLSIKTMRARANLDMAMRHALVKRSSSSSMQITAIRIEKDPDEEDEK